MQVSGFICCIRVAQILLSPPKQSLDRFDRFPCQQQTTCEREETPTVFWWPFQITNKIKAMLPFLAAYRSNIYLDLVHLYMKPLHLVSASLIHSNSTATFTFSDFMLSSFPRKMMVLIWVFQMITFFTNFMFPFPEQHSSCRYTIPIDTLVFDFDMPQVVLGGCGHMGKRRVS